MATITLRRGDSVAIPFTITDSASGFGAVRVSWVVAEKPTGRKLLTKQSELGSPQSSAGVTISSLTASSISGYVNLDPADYVALPNGKTLYASLWVDDGAGAYRCVTDGGYDYLTIQDAVSLTGEGA